MLRKASGPYRLLVEESINVQSWIIAYSPNEHLILDNHPLSTYACSLNSLTVIVNGDLLYMLQKIVPA